MFRCRPSVEAGHLMHSHMKPGGTGKRNRMKRSHKIPACSKTSRGSGRDSAGIAHVLLDECVWEVLVVCLKTISPLLAGLKSLDKKREEPIYPVVVSRQCRAAAVATATVHSAACMKRIAARSSLGVLLRVDIFINFGQRWSRCASLADFHMKSGIYTPPRLVAFRWIIEARRKGLAFRIRCI